LGSRPICTKTRRGRACGLAGGAVGVAQAGHLLAVADHLGGEGADDDVDVGQAAQLALQHLVGAQRVVELDQGDVADDAGEVDRGLDAGVAAADHRDALALEQRAVAVGAVGDALVAVLGLAGHVHLAPAGAGGQHDGALCSVAPLSSSTVSGRPARRRGPAVAAAGS
jgi:hypothetical protein